MNYLNYHTGRPRFHFQGEPTPPIPPAPPTPPAPAWHEGIEPETLGFWQNKGYDISSPKALAAKLTEQYRAAERHIGAPPDQIIRMPKADAKPEEIAAMWQRLGAPKDPKEYDFSGIKFSGNDLEPSFSDAMRAGLAAAFVPKDKAAAIVKSVVGYLESADATETTLTTAKLAEERATLEKNWGGKDSNSYRFNLLQAKEGASRLGLDPEAVAGLEGVMGYSKIMDALRKIGNARREDVFVDNPTHVPGSVTTREGAMARKQELFADKAWVTRLNAGDSEAKAEWKRLNQMIDGEAA